MNGFERAARDNKIVALRARGFSEQSIATKFKIGPDRVHDIMEDWKATRPTLRTADPLAIIDEMIDGYHADLEQLSDIAENAKNDSAAVGAINARMAARDRIIALLQTTGVLPHDLGKIRVDIDVRYIAQKMVAVLNAHGVPADVQKELLTTLQQGELAAAGEG